MQKNIYYFLILLNIKKMLISILIVLSISIYNILCDSIPQNELNLLINSFQINVEKKYEEANELISNGTVSRFNIPFRFKLYTMKLDVSRMENNIEKLKHPNNKDYHKYFDDYIKIEKSFVKAYKHLLRIMIGTNNFYIKTIRTIKIIFIVAILIIFLGGIIALLIMYYISKYKYKDYSSLVDKDKKDKKNQYQIVEIFNSFFNFNKKIK